MTTQTSMVMKPRTNRTKRKLMMRSTLFSRDHGETITLGVDTTKAGVDPIFQRHSQKHYNMQGLTLRKDSADSKAKFLTPISERLAISILRFRSFIASTICTGERSEHHRLLMRSSIRTSICKVKWLEIEKILLGFGDCVMLQTNANTRSTLIPAIDSSLPFGMDTGQQRSVSANVLTKYVPKNGHFGFKSLPVGNSLGILWMLEICEFVVKKVLEQALTTFMGRMGYGANKMTDYLRDLVSKSKPGDKYGKFEGTGSAGATVRMYIEQFEPDVSKHDMDAQTALKPLIDLALSVSKRKDFTRREKPIVIT
ncbi:hypothetical protein TEA_014551 [Camellia sinensis var. sinensis]|uniref:Uncharacterized protein n=1 Tax=Camellia sinensis var. sinensis TaxID=542762 RepID=A0A4S4E9V4_CAMSN|nr:hypothetical protein TEA_014551 [Camellia sinensis var. sinensis]